MLSAAASSYSDSSLIHISLAELQVIRIRDCSSLMAPNMFCIALVFFFSQLVISTAFTMAWASLRL
jgi:hypothetical protein